jgi:hypothetical protein
MASPRTCLLVALVVIGPACAEVDDVPDGGDRRDSAPAAPDLGPTSSLNCSLRQDVSLVSQPTDVLFLLDRSGSMDVGFGPGTRYQAVAAILEEIATTYGARVRFGYQEMPGRQGCAGIPLAACCASPPSVGVADANAAAVVAAIGAASPMDGSTPTAAALSAAASYYDGLADGILNRYVLLATDGAPNCTITGELTSPTSPATGACADAIAQATALVARGVRVVVLGVGADLADAKSDAGACLDDLAHAGGAAASPGSPGYYTASDPEELQMAIEQIFGGINRPSCDLRFKEPLQDTSKVAIYLDGQQIPRNSGDGWRLDTSQDPPVARITGAYCDAIETFQVGTIEALYQCGNPAGCIDIGGCK